jgi:hypothetical protein
MNYYRNKASSSARSNILVTHIPPSEAKRSQSPNRRVRVMNKEPSSTTESTTNLSCSSTEWNDTSSSLHSAKEVLAEAIGEAFDHSREMDSPQGSEPSHGSIVSKQQQEQPSNGKSFVSKKSARKALVDLLAQAMVKVVLDENEEAINSHSCASTEVGGGCDNSRSSGQESETSTLRGDSNSADYRRRRASSISTATSLHSQFSGASGSSGELSLNEVQAYVMEIIPESLKAHLAPETWDGILSAAAQHQAPSDNSPSQNDNSSSHTTTPVSPKARSPIVDLIPPAPDTSMVFKGRRNSEPHREVSSTSLNEAGSVVSELTDPTAFSSFSSMADQRSRNRLGDSFSSTVHRRASTNGSSLGSLHTQSPVRRNHSSSVLPMQGTDTTPRCPIHYPCSPVKSRHPAPAPVLFPPNKSSRVPSSSDAPPRCPTRPWQSATDGTTSAPRLPFRQNSDFRTGGSTISEGSDLVDSHSELGRVPPARSNPRSQSLTESMPPKRAPVQRSVSFNHIQVRYYERVLDMNPCTSSGPSVGLGWQYFEPPHMKTVDEVERSLPDRRVGPIPLPRHVREDIIRELGYSQKEVARAIRISIKTKHQRRQTINNLSSQKVEEIVEKSRKKVKKILRLGGSKKKNTVESSYSSSSSTSSPRHAVEPQQQQRPDKKVSKSDKESSGKKILKTRKAIKAVSDSRWN